MKLSILVLVFCAFTATAGPPMPTPTPTPLPGGNASEVWTEEFCAFFEANGWETHPICNRYH